MAKEKDPTHYDGKLIIGLTGNIATGKSAVMRLAADHGALTIDADKVVHDLMNKDKKLQQAIAAQFSSKVLRDDGRIDRNTLGQIVFSDPESLAILEAIVHPVTRAELDKRILDSKAAVVVIEAIKLLEGNLSDSCHQIWVTRCDRQKQLERLRVCRGMGTAEAANRIKSQGAQEEKVAFADVVIDTNGLMADTESQFEMAWSRLPDLTGIEAKPRLDLTALPIPQPGPKTTEATETEAETAVAEETAKEKSTAPDMSDLAPLEMTDLPDDLQVRRARPNDIPSILLLIQQATDGAVKMKRGDLLLALSERGYFIGQVGSDISAIFGWNIDSQVGRVDEIYIHPPEMISVTGTAVLQEIENSAKAHLCQIIVVFLPNNSPDDLRRLLVTHGFETMAEESLTSHWRLAVEESQPDDTFYMIKVLLDTRKESIVG